jgi:hypothetical protein
VFSRSSHVSPFLTVGVGVVDDGSFSAFDEFYFKAGVGVLGDLVTFSNGSLLQLKADAARPGRGWRWGAGRAGSLPEYAQG